VDFDLNLWYNAGDIAWVIAASALVWFMVPGVGFYYGGLARRKSALSMIWLPLMSLSVATFQVFHAFTSLVNF
jgi:Amt family ammonium transporter